MNIFSAVFLGLVQGLTEFLPVSSSGHLVLVQSLIPGFTQPGILFDVVLHGGTLVAVFVYFWKRITSLSTRTATLLALGTIPAGLVGFLFQDFLEGTFSDVRSVGIQLIITGVLCYLIDRAKTKKKEIKSLDAILIGIAQAVAIIPGISRSGTTIFAGVYRGITRSEVAEFSFLLSIPAILGAIALQVLKHNSLDGVNLMYYSAGFISSLIFGLLSIKILLQMLTHKSFKIFAVYCFIVGAVAILV